MDDEEIILSSKFEKRMKRLMWREKHKWVADLGKFMVKVAVVCLCILGVSFAVTMSVDAYRSKFFQTVQELLGDESALHTYDANEDIQEFEPHEPTYIPEGYVEVERYQNSECLSIVFVNENEQYCYWDQRTIHQGEKYVLDVEYESQDIYKLDNGIVTLSYYDRNYIYAYYETESYVYCLDADNLSAEEIIKMYNSIE